MHLNLDSRLYVAGHRGLVGSAIVRKLRKDGFRNLIYRTSEELDLRDQASVRGFFQSERPEFVFLAAAKVGGIWANDQYRADFIRDNLLIQDNVINAAFDFEVKKLIFLGSSCIYPKFAPQPIPESALLTGPLEPTNEAYAVAKIAGIMLCKSIMIQYGRPFISLMPTNLYGPGDNYDLQDSHVLPALIRKFHEAKTAKMPEMTAWGTGRPLREFMHSDDLADAVLFCLRNYSGIEHLNIGTGQEIRIRDLTEVVRRVVGYEGRVVWDPSKPDGTPRKLMDSTRLNQLGWKSKISLEDGIRDAYLDFLKKHNASQ